MIAASLLSLLVLLPPASGAGRRDFNVLLITVDTLRPDRLGCYGSVRAKTPRIDGLAEKGALFQRAFAHATTTLASHASILLGSTPVVHGVHDNQSFVVRDELLALAEHLRGNGYACGAFVGAFPLDSRFGLSQGFDVYDDRYGSGGSEEYAYAERKAEAVVREAVRWLKDRSGPWFLWVHCYDPHLTYAPPEPFRTEYADALYDGEVAYVDYALGPLLDHIQSRGLEGRTVVILTADHGESLGEHGEPTHGYFAYNSTLHVPLVIDVPGVPARTVEAPVAHIDIFPTVCEVLELDRPAGLEGYSLLAAVRGENLPSRSIYFESLYPYYSRGWAPLRGCIMDGMKFMDSPIPEIYDLTKDFNETANLAGSSPLDPLRRRLQALTRSERPAASEGSRPAIDPRTRERLESLGYISGPGPARTKVFTARDDLKTLLPFQARLHEAMALCRGGQAARGAGLLREIIAERSDFDQAYTYLATMMKQGGDLRGAVRVLEGGYRHCPDNPKVVLSYGLFLAEEGDPNRAIEILKKGTDLFEKDPELWNGLGVAYSGAGLPKEAGRAFERALSLDRDYPTAIENLGSLRLSLYLKTGAAKDLRDAAALFRKAIALDPASAPARNGLGLSLKLLGDLAGAIANWEKALAVRPDFGYALFNLGLAHLQRGEKSQALGYLQRYKALAYAGLPAEEKTRLDVLLARCR